MISLSDHSWFHTRHPISINICAHITLCTTLFSRSIYLQFHENNYRCNEMFCTEEYHFDAFTIIQLHCDWYPVCLFCARFSVGSYMLINNAPFLPENHIHSLVHVFRKARFILFKTCQSLFLKRYFFSLKKYWIYMPTCVYKTKQNKKVKIFSSWNFEIWKLYIFLLINSHHLCYISFCCI